MTVSALFVGGMDSSGGAGLMRDCATAAAMGAAPRVAVTAVTAQTDRSVTSLHPVPAPDVAAQMKAAGQVGAVKLGMLGTARIVETVADNLPNVPLVLDPVLASSSGRALLDEAGLRALLSRLLCRTTLLTPNLPELRALATWLGLADGADERARVRALMAQGCAAVLVKGGHAGAGQTCEDRLYMADGDVFAFSGPRFAVALRGTGCQLASAIAVGLGSGQDMRTAIATARELLQARFRKALQQV